MEIKLSKKRKVAYIIETVIEIVCALVPIVTLVLVFMGKIPGEIEFMAVMFLFPVMMSESAKEDIIREQEAEDWCEVKIRKMKEAEHAKSNK